MSDLLTLGSKQFRSRLLVGTGRYDSFKTTADVVKAAGAEIITVAVRRVNLGASGGESLQHYLPPKDYTYLPNTAGCHTAEDAMRTLRLAREAGGWSLVKLEVIGRHSSLYPDMLETLKACEQLAKEGFEVMAYATDDPVMAKRLEDAGAIAVMPLGAPIGSGRGILNPLNIKMIVDQAKVPVLVDAGIGTASDACIAMELGCAGVLLNTAIAESKNPVQMAEAMNHAVKAGRAAYLAGRMPVRDTATASSPTTGKVENKKAEGA